MLVNSQGCKKNIFEKFFKNTERFAKFCVYICKGKNTLLDKPGFL